MELTACPKWQASYAAYKKDKEGSKKRVNDSSVINLEDGFPSKDGHAVWLGAHKLSKQYTCIPENFEGAMLAEKEKAYGNSLKVEDEGLLKDLVVILIFLRRFVLFVVSFNVRVLFRKKINKYKASSSYKDRHSRYKREILMSKRRMPDKEPRR
jgi:hypothetical protein